jgi:hypothetical protein
MDCLNEILVLRPEGNFFVTKFEFGGSFGMSLDLDCHEVEVTHNLKLLVTFGMSLGGVCHELYT